MFGYPLGEPSDLDSARQVLESVGLSYLAEKWLLNLDRRDEPVSVQIVEASPRRVVVKNVDYGYEGDIGDRFALDVPARLLERYGSRLSTSRAVSLQ